MNFIDRGLPDNTSLNLFGYYGATSVCMPRFYVAHGESAWEYTTLIITINFVSFLFIAVSYIMILKHASQSSKNIRKVRKNKSNNQGLVMQKRVARIIATNFCCWIPICVMAYVRLGVEFSDIVYQISAVLLLPINSAINPFLFTSMPDKMVKLWRKRTKSRVTKTHSFR